MSDTLIAVAVFLAGLALGIAATLRMIPPVDAPGTEPAEDTPETRYRRTME